MLRALAAVSSLDARPLRPSKGKPSFPLISAGINLIMEQKNEKKSVWGVLLKVIIAVATAIAGALGIQSCIL